MKGMLPMRPGDFLPLLLVAFLLALNAPARAQDTASREQQRNKIREPEEARRGVEAELVTPEWELSQELELDYGGYFDFTTSDYSDSDGEHVLRTTNIRLWGNMVYEDTYQLYARILTAFKDYNAGSQYSFDEENDNSIARLEVGYFNTDLTRALGLEDYGRLQLRMGRDYFRAGSGMTLDRRGDGARLEYTRGAEGFRWSAFAMRSIYSEDGFDRSYPDLGHDKRIFGGTEISQELARELEVYGFVVLQRFNGRKKWPPGTLDYSTPPNDVGDQLFGNDSNYYGIGVRGEIGPDFYYMAEYVREKGDRYSAHSDVKDDVDATAYNLEARYMLRNFESQPDISLQYVAASGDGDAMNTVDTLSGNLAGTDYNAFTPYGYVNTGLAFFPRLSNIHVTRLGGSFRPVRDNETLGEIEAGVNGFYYRRDNKNGGISDRMVIPGPSVLGKELDFYLIWRPFSDVSVLAQYGAFWPEKDAFSDPSKRHYFSLTFLFFF